MEALSAQGPLARTEVRKRVRLNDHLASAYPGPVLLQSFPKTIREHLLLQGMVLEKWESQSPDTKAAGNFQLPGPQGWCLFSLLPTLAGVFQLLLVFLQRCTVTAHVALRLK